MTPASIRIRYRPLMLAATLAVAAAPGPLMAQDALPEIEQVRSGGAGPIDQISSDSRGLSPSSPAARDITPPAQLGSESGVRPTTQLTSERGAAPQRQVTTGVRTAAAPESSSRPADGRTGAIAPVEGQDRCDPAEEEAEGRLCDRVIETRSAEFERPAQSILSPEQRLLIDQRLREAPATTRTAARRLGQGDFDPNSPEEQAVASVAMRGSATGPASAREEPEPTEIDPAVQAILGIINATQTPQ